MEDFTELNSPVLESDSKYSSSEFAYPAIIEEENFNVLNVY
jgi:hypothetical protein